MVLLKVLMLVLPLGTGLGDDEGIDLMPYFAPSAYSGFGDDEHVSNL